MPHADSVVSDAIESLMLDCKLFRDLDVARLQLAPMQRVLFRPLFRMESTASSQPDFEAILL